tara:strand:- start:660 stop:3191 length:2532 start_codon:yes stop_codon:yes gene_type:complete
MNPLNVGITDPEVRHQRIETIILFPRDCRDDTSGSGGHATFILPHRGYLSPDTRMIIPAVCAKEGYDYPPNVGVFSLIKSATLRVGSAVVSQLNNAAQYYALKHNLKPLEHREKIDEPLHGMKFSFEGCSGANLLGAADGREVFAGQHRIVASDGYEPQVGFQNSGSSVPPPVEQGKFYKAYKLSSVNNDSDTAAGTPEYQIELSQLFPNFFGKRIEIPLQLINPDDEVAIDIVWTTNTTWGKNERAALYPALVGATDTPTSLKAVAYEIHDAVTANNTTRGAGFVIGGDIAAAGTMSILEMGGTRTTQLLNKIVVTRGGADAADVSGVRLGAFYNAGNGFGGAGGYLEKIRILDCGKGLQDGDVIRISSVNNAGSSANDCRLVVASKIVNIAPAPVQPAAGIADIAAFTNPQNLNLGSGGGNLAAGNNGGLISAGGAGYAAGQLIPMKNQMDEGNAVFNVVVLSHNGGAVTACRLASQEDANRMLMSRTFAAGTSNSYAAVAGGLVIQCRAAMDADNNVDKEYGLKHSLFEYDTLATGGKINIVADKVRMITDLVHYEDGRMENDAKKMMGEGLQMIYGELRNVETTLTSNTQYPATSNPTSASSAAAEHTRQIGLSNEVLRDIVIADNPNNAVRVSNYYPHKGLANLNPLLLQYCSRDSLKEDGNKLQVTINSVPRFPAPLNQSAHFYNELRNVYGMPFYSPEALYNGYTSCKQEDNNGIATTKQTGFTDNGSKNTIDVVAQQFQLNDRKMGMTNQEFEGISQKALNGMGHYMGLDFKIGGQANFAGNGIAIGSQAVQLDYTYTSTQDPQFSGNSTLNCWAEVERYFQLKGGVVSVSAASM